jgi:predicted nuclease of predicted toxin-antitoxin system
MSVSRLPPRLLLDSNLPRRLARQLADIFPGTEHIALGGLLHGDDDVVWHYARSSDFCLVTTGGDFYELATTQALDSAVELESDTESGPKSLLKAIWLRECDYPASQAEVVLRRESTRILSFLEDPDLAFLVLDRV